MIGPVSVTLPFGWAGNHGSDSFPIRQGRQTSRDKLALIRSCPASATCSAARPATYLGAYVIAVPDWSEGDTFTDKDGRRFRIASIDPSGGLDAIHTTWTVEPL